jgi:hypothetical protein
MGRHSHPDEIEAPDLAAINAIAQFATPVPAGSPTKTSAVADLQLVLHNPRLLATCVAAAIAPFVCYFAVILGAHATSDWAIFLGAPLVAAGVLVGAALDRAYAPATKPAPAAPAALPALAVTAPASATPAELG